MKRAPATFVPRSPSILMALGLSKLLNPPWLIFNLAVWLLWFGFLFDDQLVVFFYHLGLIF